MFEHSSAVSAACPPSARCTRLQADTMPFGWQRRISATHQVAVVPLPEGVPDEQPVLRIRVVVQQHLQLAVVPLLCDAPAHQSWHWWSVKHVKRLQDGLAVRAALIQAL